MLDRRPLYAPRRRDRIGATARFSSAPAAPPGPAAPARLATPTDAGAVAPDLDKEIGQWGGSGWTRAEVCAYRKALRKTHTTAPDAGFPRVAEASPNGYASAGHAVEVALATLRRSAPGDAALLRELSLGALYCVDPSTPGAGARPSRAAEQR